MSMFKTTLLATALLAAFPLVAQAESTFVTGTGKLSAAAKLDFSVTIPQILLLQVGTAGAVDTIVFDMTGAASAVGDNVAVSGTGGDQAGGKVTARLLGNVGNVTLSSTTSGPLSNGAGDTISYSQINATSSNGFAPPALADAATTGITVNATGKIINQSAQWTFKYANAAVVAPGVYGGGGAGNTGNGRVTYTASMP